MSERQAKPKKLSMVQQSIIDARNAPALTPEMQAALDALVSAPGEDKPAESANHHNGTSGKTLITDAGPLRIGIPRDRAGAFEPLIVPKHGRRFEGFDDLILSMYARGMSIRDIRAHLTGVARGRVSGGRPANLYRAFNPQQPGLRELEGSQDRGSGIASDLHRGKRRSGTSRADGIRAIRMGNEAAACGGIMAAGVGVCDAVLRVPARDSAGDLHHQRHRVRERTHSQSHQDERPFPQRRGGDQADLAGAEKYH